MKRTAIFTAAAFLACSNVQAQTLLIHDGFTPENGGASALNYASFANWNVSGVVDLIRSGDFGITCVAGTGSCVDIDGSQNTGGALTSKTAFSFSAGDRVVVSFMASGSQRTTATDVLRMSLNFSAPTTFSSYTSTIAGVTTSSGAPTFVNTGWSASATLAPTDAFSMWTLDFTAANAGTFVLILDTTSNDNVGPIVDDIAVRRFDAQTNVVPEPATWTLMLSGLGILGVAARRRRAV